MALSPAASAETGGDYRLAGMHFTQKSMKWLKAVSGIQGSITQTADGFAEKDSGGKIQQSGKIHALNILEGADDPVRIKVKYEKINPDQLFNTPGYYWEKYDCRSAVHTSKPMQVDVGAHRVATAVQVCIHNDKIKGIRLWGVHVNKDATLGAKTYTAEAKRKHCKTGGWAQKIKCANNKAISKSRFFYKSTKSGFSGIGIQCAKIAPNFPPEAVPKKRPAPVKGAGKPSIKKQGK